MEQNFKLIIEYDGTAYHGWQRQKTDPSIQAEIETALNTMTRRKITLNGSGRTDAGVHALRQVANFSCDTRLGPDAFQKGLNSLLPDAIVITGCEKISEDFHARYAAKSKIYRYRILNRRIPAAIGRQYAWHIRKQLDMPAMKKGAAHLVGTHDFKAFEGSGSPRSSTIRTIMKADFIPCPEGYQLFEIRADGFLKFMVRNIVGTLVAVGFGKITPGDVHRILRGKDRNRAGATAPAHGLTLMDVEYS
jgi:tRNA pseudouridine38-40 synthase